MKTLKTLVVIAIIGIVISTFAINKVIAFSDKIVGYSIGDIASDFALKNIDNQIVSLSDFETAKGFIVVFTCNHCPYSIAYEDRIIALDKKYAPQGYPVIAINPDDQISYLEDSFVNMKIRAVKKGFTFPYLIDDKQKVYSQYGADKTPHVYILEKTVEGNIVRYIGAIDNNYKGVANQTINYVQDALDSLLRNKDIEIETTKSIGCSVKN